MDVPDFGCELLLRPDRQAGLLPGGPAAGQGSRLGPPCSTKLSRHPGACGFVLSGTVENQRGVAVQAAFSGEADRIVRWEPDRADGHLGALPVAPLGADIEQDHGLAGGLEGEHFGDGDAFGGSWVGGTAGGRYGGRLA